MAAVSLAILGKDGEPLYIKEFRDDDDDSDGGAGGGSASKAVAEEELFGLPAPPASASFDEDDGVGAARGRRHQGGAFDCSVRQQFILHAALDRFDQLSGPPPGCAWRRQGATGRDAMFAGLLCPVEDLRVYGYQTTTQIRFLLAVEDGGMFVPSDQRAVDESVKRLFAKLHDLFVEHRLNPFSNLKAPISSSKFDSKVKACVANFNRDEIL